MNEHEASPHTWQAPHVSPEADDVLELIRRFVHPAGGLHAIVEVSGGLDDVLVDVFDDPVTRSSFAVSDPASLRSACRRAARQLCAFTQTEEERLDDAGTGRLIRVVLHGDRGAVLCYAVVPGQFVVGFVGGPAGWQPGSALSDNALVDPADRAMTALVNDLRRRVELPPQDAGGWTDDRDLVTAPTGTNAHLDIEPNIDGDAQDSALPLLRSAVHHDDLHFLALVRNRELAVAADQFSHPRLRTPVGAILPSARRKFYCDLARELAYTASQQARLLRSIVGGSLLRLVLDVEQGAVYYYPRDDAYLVGVTLYQRQVNRSDRKVALLIPQLH